MEKAVRYLRKEVGVKKIFLVGHSMGSRMASAYAKENSGRDIAGLVVIGCRNNGGAPFNCQQNVEGLKLPILDLWGGGDKKDDQSAIERRFLQSDTYTQIEVPGAGHKFDGYEDELVTAVAEWLKAQ